MTTFSTRLVWLQIISVFIVHFLSFHKIERFLHTFCQSDYTDYKFMIWLFQAGL
jgi:hypothetical protein